METRKEPVKPLTAEQLKNLGKKEIVLKGKTEKDKRGSRSRNKKKQVLSSLKQKKLTVISYTQKKATIHGSAFT